MYWISTSQCIPGCTCMYCSLPFLRHLLPSCTTLYSSCTALCHLEPSCTAVYHLVRCRYKAVHHRASLLKLSTKQVCFGAWDKAVHIGTYWYVVRSIIRITFDYTYWFYETAESCTEIKTSRYCLRTSICRCWEYSITSNRLLLLSNMEMDRVLFHKRRLLLNCWICSRSIGTYQMNAVQTLPFAGDSVLRLSKISYFSSTLFTTVSMQRRESGASSQHFISLGDKGST